MTMQLHQLRCLDAVVRHGSFRAAGEALHLSQPAISMHVSNLERNLGFKVLRRSTKGSVLTEAGTEMLPHLRAVLRAEEAAAQHAEAVSGGQTGRVRVGAINAAIVGLMPTIVQHLAADGIDVTVAVTELTAAEVRAQVNDGTFDVGLTTDWKDLKRPGVVSESLAEGPLALVARRGHPLLSAPTLDAELVARQPLVTVRAGLPLRLVLNSYLNGQTPTIAFETAAPDTVWHLVAAGMGVTVVPSISFHTRGGHPDLAMRPLDDSDVRTHLWVLHPGEDATPATRAFVAAVRAVATDRFSQMTDPGRVA